MNPALVQKFKVPDGKGVLVSDVIRKSAAEEAGIKYGDVIIEFNGKPVIDPNQLKIIVGQVRPGDSATVKVLRDGKEKSFKVTLKETKDQDQNVESDNPNTAGEDALDGVVVTDIDAAARAQLRLPANLKGALVMQIEEGTAAAEAGLREGDVIVEIDNKAIRTAEDAVNATKGLKNAEIVLRVYSRGGFHYLTVDETKKK